MRGKWKKGMFGQLGHGYLRGRVRGGFAFADAGRPAFLVVYLLTGFLTGCQVTVRNHVLSYGYDGC